jgi:Holliday junction resolvase-like predicted endonuclease
MNKSNDIGKAGEELVKNWYIENGFTFVVSNFQYFRSGVRGQNGEIDLVFLKDKKLHLVEVKSRFGTGLGHPLDQITPKKLAFLQKTYLHFLTKYPQFRECFVQFDAAVVQSGKVEILPNAYSSF